MEALKRVALAAAIICMLSASVCFLQLARTSYKVQTDVHTTTQKLNTTVDAASTLVTTATKSLHDTTQDLNAVLLQSETTVNEIRLAAEGQTTYWNEAGEQTVATIGSVNKTVDSLQTTVQGIGLDVDKITNSTVVAMNAVAPALENLQQPLAAATRLQNDASLILESPTIPATQANIQHTTATFDHTAVTIDGFITRVTKPASVVKSVIWKLLGIAPSAAVAFK